MPKLYIPPLGTVLTLAEPWTFVVYNEYRNTALMHAAGLERCHLNGVNPYLVKDAGIHTFPAGTQLTVDRIYIKQGASNFNSVTFRTRDVTSPPRKGRKEPVVRFWAKLRDVNEMVIA